MDLAFVVNPTKASTLRALVRARACAGSGAHGLALWTPAVAALQKRADYAGEADGWPLTDDPAAADAVVALGGDGTLLQAVRLLRGTPRPLLGVNLGSLGFLTDTPEELLEESLTRLLSGQYRIDRRMLLDVGFEPLGQPPLHTIGLNDVVLHGPRARVLELEIAVGGVKLARMLADGVLVATPSGSTAYNLSAGGPVVSPLLDALILTPISAHTLSQRPLVVGADEAIEITLVRTASERAELTVDGHVSHEMNVGDRVIVTRAQATVSLVVTRERTFYDTLRTKLGWGHRGRSV